MKIRELMSSKNQHVLAIEHAGELRAYFKHPTLHMVLAAGNALRRDIAKHGEVFVLNLFAGMPKITVRTSKRGRKVYDIEE